MTATTRLARSSGDFRADRRLASSVRTLQAGRVAALVLAASATLLAAATGALADGRTYAPAGAPADPKVSVQWNRYHDYADATSILRSLAEAHPTRAKLRSLGRSTLGSREMWLLTVTDPAGPPADSKPAFYIDGGIHANELQGPEVVLYTAWYLLETAERSPFVARLLRERTFYFVPMLSPDGRDAHMHEPHTTHSPRSGAIPIDDDADGRFDEDGADDLDGDGHITQMRVRDPNGRWKEHPDHPGLLVPCGPDERGSFSLLGQEGTDDDGDGDTNEDGPGYYDPNRDWGWDWQPGYVQPGAYRYPFSVGENRLVAEWLMERPNVAGAQSYHNAAGMILRGPGRRGESYDAGDLAALDAIGKKGEVILPSYRYTDVGSGLYECFGLELDWLYRMRGVAGFTNELFTGFNYFRKPDARWFGSPEETHLFNRLLLFGDGIVPWHEVEHPTLGRVEIGGMKKTWGRQPPSFLLEEECHRNMAFTLYHADQLPLVRVDGVSVRGLGGGLSEVTATVANDRILPTRLAVDRAVAVTPPDRVEILLAEGARVVAGYWSHDRLFSGAEPARRDPASLRVDVIPGMGVVHARWIVEGPVEGLRVRVRSVKGGEHVGAPGAERR